jgi:hypothetical protein
MEAFLGGALIAWVIVLSFGDGENRSSRVAQQTIQL